MAYLMFAFKIQRGVSRLSSDIADIAQVVARRSSLPLSFLSLTSTSPGLLQLALISSLETGVLHFLVTQSIDGCLKRMSSKPYNTSSSLDNVYFSN